MTIPRQARTDASANQTGGTDKKDAHATPYTGAGSLARLSREAGRISRTYRVMNCATGTPE